MEALGAWIRTRFLGQPTPPASNGSTASPNAAPAQRPWGLDQYAGGGAPSAIPLPGFLRSAAPPVAAPMTEAQAELAIQQMELQVQRMVQQVQ
ncbi:MAG: hypothetical protein JWM80_1827, partial [Cyanobacteria bacterium RYN_339]|nr:hypothetical protein [Cyanobacteria bacterium RYN_339]